MLISLFFFLLVLGKLGSSWIFAANWAPSDFLRQIGPWEFVGPGKLGPSKFRPGKWGPWTKTFLEETLLSYRTFVHFDLSTIAGNEEHNQRQCLFWRRQRPVLEKLSFESVIILNKHRLFKEQRHLVFMKIFRDRLQLAGETNFYANSVWATSGVGGGSTLLGL